MRTFIRVVGYSLVALMFAGLVLTVLLAARNGQPFYGRNAYGLALGTYSTLALFLICGVIGVVWVVRKVLRRPD